MIQFVDIVEVNPIVFVKKIVEQISQGFYVQNSIVGYPIVGLPYQIRLFQTEAPEVRNKLADEVHTVVVEGYDIMRWLLDVQDVALQGFDMSLTQAVVDNYKGITMIKAVPVQFDLGVVSKANPEAHTRPTKRTSKAKPTTTPETQEGE